MSAPLRLRVDGVEVEVADGASVAAAVAQVAPFFRRSPLGAPRAPLCGMGVCFECRVTVDDEPHVLACLTPARAGMEVRTDG